MDDSAPTPKWRLTLAALRLHWAEGPWLLGLAGFAALAAVALKLGVTATTGRLISAIPIGHEAVTQAVILIAILEGLRAACDTHRWTLILNVGRRYRRAHRSRIIDAYLDPPGVAHSANPEVADAAKAADPPWVVNMLEGVMSVGVARLTGLGAAGLVALHEPVAGLLLTVGWWRAGAWGWAQASAVNRVVTGQSQALRRAEAISDLATSPQRAKEVRVFGLAPWIGDRFTTEWTTAMAKVWKERAAASRGVLPAALLLAFTHIAALGLIGRSALAGRFTPGDLAVLLQAVVLTRNLGVGVFGHWEVEYGLRSIPHLARLETTVARVAEPMAGTRPITALTSEIRLQGVRFRYPGQESEVLRGVDLDIPAGSSLALVGENGAGKTTAVQLIARLRDPTSGRILIDGTDLREFDPRAWHRLVAAVSQTALRMTLSVADNIGAGRTSDRAVMERAAAGAGVLDLIESFPLAWDTPMARDLVDGVEVSGGQWQRIALARGLAAIESGAEVLLLDEPTAHLDVRAEADLYGHFLELARGKTVILVSHRFSTVRRADRIVVLERGAITEIGDHASLVEVGGRYAEMFSYQAARFGDDVAPVPLSDTGSVTTT